MTDVAFYDRTMTEQDAPAMLPLENSPWRELYCEAARWIPANHDVVDLGCGTGRFFHGLYLTGHYGKTVGLDFSEQALAEARAYLIATANADPDLRLVDLADWQPEPDRAGATSYVCLEVLEHLDDDIDLVRRVPSGHQFVFSVPSYESESHERWFRNVSDIWERYDRLLEFNRWSLIRLDGQKAIHALDTTRRQDSW